jgi:hypothetical protein
LDRSFEMLVSRVDGRVIVSLVRRPGDPNQSMVQTQRMMKSVEEEQINQVAGLVGLGKLGTGYDNDGHLIEYVLFYPQTGSPLQDYYLYAVFANPDVATVEEFDRVVRSINVAAPGGR